MDKTASQQSAHEVHPEQHRESPQTPGFSGPHAGLLALQRAAGNRAVDGLLGGQDMADTRADEPATLLQQAAGEPGLPLDESVRTPLEERLSASLRHVRVHSGPRSAAAAAAIDARAYTVGGDIYLGNEASDLNQTDRARLLAHEAVHALQQGRGALPLQGSLSVSQPSDPAEGEARRIAESLSIPTGASLSLALRDNMRITSVGPTIQRDITGSKNLTFGKLEINFKKTDGTVVGDIAQEDGKIVFTANNKAPQTDSIKFVQIAHAVDTTGLTGKAGEDLNFAKIGKGELAPLNQQATVGNAKKNIAPGFFVDQIPASLAKRTKKSDPTVEPYYDVSGPPLKGNVVGKHKGKVNTPAELVDTPNSTFPFKVNFVTSAKATDVGTWLGTVLWGFEYFTDKKGVLKIRGEYHSFREVQGETTDEALKNFDEFYRNPGATTAPKK